MKYIVCLLFLGFTITGVYGQKDGYSLFWADEFNGNELDTSKWEYRDLGPRRNGVNVKEAVTLTGDGKLAITARKVGDDYHVGMIGTQPTFQTTYGLFECRVKMQKEIGHWSAFWLQSPTMGEEYTGNPQKYGTEIDIFEYLRRQKDTTHQHIHWDGYGEEHKSVGHSSRVFGLGKGYHTISVEWTPDSYTFYIDGVETWETDTAVSHRSEYIILSSEVGKWAGDISKASLPDTVFFDYVRVYKKDPDD
jgi:beta-glucanase (GH16 family)